MAKRRRSSGSASKIRLDENLDSLFARINLDTNGRVGKIDLVASIEVAYGVLFLASEKGSFITERELVIDGGFIAQ